jgi:hypothetical protein
MIAKLFLSMSVMKTPEPKQSLTVLLEIFVSLFLLSVLIQPCEIREISLKQFAAMSAYPSR